MKTEVEYLYTIKYASGRAVVGIGAGFALIILGVILNSSWNSKWPLIYLGIVGVICIIRHVKRIVKAESQVKFAKAGIWTPKSGFQSWQQVEAKVKGIRINQEVRGEILTLLLIRRDNSEIIEKIPVAPLAVGATELKAIIASVQTS